MIGGSPYLYRMRSRRGQRSRNFYTFLVLYATLVIGGASAYCYLWADVLGNQARENLLYLAECDTSVSPQEILAFKARFDTDPDFHRIEYISPERAAALLREDALSSLDGGDEMEEALPALLAIRLSASVYEEGREEEVIGRLRQQRELFGIYAQPELADRVRTQLKKIGQGLAVAGILIFLLAVAVISGLLKLSLFTSRTEIKTMQLTGATPAYIRTPYLKQYAGLAFLAGMLAGLTILLLHFSLTGFALPGQENLLALSLLVAGILLFGILLSLWITYRMVNTYIFADIATLF